MERSADPRTCPRLANFPIAGAIYSLEAGVEAAAGGGCAESSRSIGFERRKWRVFVWPGEAGYSGARVGAFGIRWLSREAGECFWF